MQLDPLHVSSFHFSPSSRRGLNSINPVCDPDQPAHYLTGSVLVADAIATQNSPFTSLAVAATIASTHCAYQRRDGQAELAWVAGYVLRQSPMKAVTHEGSHPPHY